MLVPWEMVSIYENDTQFVVNRLKHAKLPVTFNTAVILEDLMFF